MTAFDLSERLTALRNCSNQILGSQEGLLGQLQAVRTMLDLLGIVTPYMSSSTVQAGPNMPPPDAPDATPPVTPWTNPSQGSNYKFNHPDVLLAVVAAIQQLGISLMTETVSFKGYDGTTKTTTIGSALAAII